MVANHEIRIKLKPGCHCRTPFSGKACRDRRSSAKTGGGSRGPQICGGRAIRLGGPRRHLLVGRRPATQLARLIHANGPPLRKRRDAWGLRVGSVAIFATALGPQKALHTFSFRALHDTSHE